MKILYGVQGTGNGHISRSRIMSRHFAAAGADVTYLISGRPHAKLFDMECFGDFLWRRGLSFTTEAGRVKYIRSVIDNNLWQFAHDVIALPVRDYDLVITDFEPVTAWAARLRKVPSLGVGHQYAFGGKAPVTGDNLAARLVMSYFAPSSVGVGLHWHHFGGDNVLPPIVDTRLHLTETREHIIVYLPFEDQGAITRLLKTFPNYRFLQYASDLRDAEDGNVGLRKTCHDGFHRDLAQSRGAICNAGFELVSECLHMGLPVLVKPVRGQMEQLSNALTLQQLGLGATMDDIDRSAISDWLQQLHPGTPQPLPDVAAHLVQWILNGDWSHPGVLAQSLWESTPVSAAIATDTIAAPA